MLPCLLDSQNGADIGDSLLSIGWVLTIDKGIVKKHFKWGLAYPDGLGQMDDPRYSHTDNSTN
jgi:hypothetical protein